MSTPTGPRVFLSYAHSDPASPSILKHLMEHYSVLTTRSIVDEMRPLAALREAVSQAAASVILLPPPGNRDRINVVFEAGVAIGMDLPVVVISDDGRLPRSLHGLPLLIGPETWELLDDTVASAIRQRTWQQAPRSRPQELRAHLNNDSNLPLLTEKRTMPATEIAKPAMTTHRLVEYVADLFKAAGSEVSISPHFGESGQDISVPDLVIWNDDLIPTLGAPLPVEIIRSSRNFPKIRNRLRRTLRASGANSLLVIAAEGESDHVWSDGDQLILLVTEKTLTDQLKYHSPARALTTILESAHA